MHRLNRINAKNPAKLLGSKSLKLGLKVKQIWPVVFMLDAQVDFRM